jgi:glycosidase
MKSHGLKLVLDFVPNHVAPDHEWVFQRPEFFVSADTSSLEREPYNFRSLATPQGEKVFAMGRDPYFPGWADTLQLNYGQPGLQSAMLEELSHISKQCDGVRCDMAMLITPEIFERTWQIPIEPFWPTAIQHIKHQHPDFLFLAEVYWDREWELMQSGFDYCYDKRLYDRLRAGHAPSVRSHLLADIAYQNRSVRFLENHDEPRAATVFGDERQMASALIAFMCPGMRFFHDGQTEGKRKRISPHLIRGPIEPVRSGIQEAYHRLLGILDSPLLRTGRWQLLATTEAWPSNFTHQDFIAMQWDGDGGQSITVVVNYSEHTSQARLWIPNLSTWKRSITLRDIWNQQHFYRDRADLAANGLFVELPPWGAHVFCT